MSDVSETSDVDAKVCECCGEPADSGYDPDRCMSCYGDALDAVDGGDW